MTNNPKPEAGGATRRDFLKTTGVAAGAALAASLFPSGVHAAGSDAIKIGLVGCGGRGTGAADNALHSAPNVHVVALADVFEDRQDGCRNYLTTHSARRTRSRNWATRWTCPKSAASSGWTPTRS